MAKLPFEKTILSAYRFGFVDLLSVVGVLWLPLLVFFALCAGILFSAWPEIHALIPADIGTQVQGDARVHQRMDEMAALFSAFARYAGLIALAGLVLRAMATVGVMEKALGRREGPVFFYFSLGAPVWRMVGATVLATIVIVLGALAACLVAAAAIWAADRYAGGIAGLIKFLAVLATLAWIVYMSLRVAFFLPAVVVAEERIGVGRAWTLGGGNVLRITGVLIAVMLPVMIVSGMISNILFGALWWNDLHAAMESGRMPVPGDIAAMVLGHLRLVWPYLAAFELADFALLTGLVLGGIASAYKSVTETPA